MTQQNKEDFLIAIHGIFYFAMLDMKVIKNTGHVKKIRQKDRTINIDDSVFLYKWLSDNVKYKNGAELQKRAEVFNSIVKSLEDDFFLNQFLMGIFMFQHYLYNEEPEVLQNKLVPKIDRLIQYMREKIIEHNKDNGREIVIDSSQAAENIYRMFNEEPQLTKEVRKARLQMWKNIKENSKK
jgi:hypothetical protein